MINISVCIATYNGEKYIKEQILSIQKQLGENDEIIISDDSSTDKTMELIKSIIDHRIKIVPSRKFNSPIKNFENALRNANGQYIFLSDQDDVWLDNKISIVMKYLNKYDLIVHDAIVTNNKLIETHSSLYQLLNSRKGILHNIIKSTYYGSCMAFKKEILSLSIPFPNTKEIGHDLWLGLIAEKKRKVIFIKDKLIFYRRHEKAFTVTGISKSNRNIIKKIFGRLVMIYYTIIK